MTVRLIKNSWMVDFRANHKRYRIRSPENSRAGAKAYEASLRHSLALGEKLYLKRKEPCDDITFEKFAWRWYDQYVKTNNKPSEQYAKENILRSNLIPFFGPMRINEITAERIQQFAAKQKVTKISPKTINNRLTVLGKCLKCANEWLEIPLPRIKLLKAQPPRTDYLTPEDCKLLLDHADGQLRTMLILALRSGMRQ